MFTGIIEEIGIVKQLVPGKGILSADCEMPIKCWRELRLVTVLLPTAFV